MSFDVNADIRKAIEDAKKPVKDRNKVTIPPPLQMDKNGCWKKQILPYMVKGNTRGVKSGSQFG